MNYTQVIRPEKVLEKNNGERKVEIAGYVSAKTRIENLISAGSRLSDYRKANYHFQSDEEVDLNFYDPTTNPDFNEMDAKDMVNNINPVPTPEPTPEVVPDASDTPPDASDTPPDPDAPVT